MHPAELWKYILNPLVCLRPYATEMSRLKPSIQIKSHTHWVFESALQYSQNIIASNRSIQHDFAPFLEHKSFIALVGLDDCNYVYPYVYAAQDAGIKCCGIQHGTYAELHEAYVMRNLSSHRWYDYLFVWGQYWKDVFLEHNGVFTTNNVRIASNKHKYDYVVTERSELKRTILIPYEFLADTLLIGKYIQALSDGGFKVFFKPRDDESVVDQIRAYHLDASFVSDMTVVSEISPDIMAEIDVVAGTQTTLLYDLLPYNKPIWVFETPFRLLDDMIKQGYARLIRWDDMKNIDEIYNKDMISSRDIDPVMFSGERSVVNVLKELL